MAKMKRMTLGAFESELKKRPATKIEAKGNAVIRMYGRAMCKDLLIDFTTKNTPRGGDRVQQWLKEKTEKFHGPDMEPMNSLQFSHLRSFMLVEATVAHHRAFAERHWIGLRAAEEATLD